MACRTERKTIGEHEYAVTQWSARAAIMNKFRLVKTLGGLMACVAVMVKDKDDGDFDSSHIVETADKAFKDSDPKELFELIESFVMGVARDGERMTSTTFEESFQGDNLFDVHKVFFFVLKVNYSNLFKGQHLAGALAKMGIAD